MVHTNAHFMTATASCQNTMTSSEFCRFWNTYLQTFVLCNVYKRFRHFSSSPKKKKKYMYMFFVQSFLDMWTSSVIFFYWHKVFHSWHLSTNVIAFIKSFYKSFNLQGQCSSFFGFGSIRIPCPQHFGANERS